MESQEPEVVESPKSVLSEPLPPLDGFHSRGRVATQELCNMGRTPLHATDVILDVGCGLGETCRFLASQYGVSNVVGVDWAEEFVSVGRVLTEKAGLADQVKLIRGNAFRLPFADETFDVVFVEHMETSIADKMLFYKEISRVLKQGGRLLFHDVFLGSPVAHPIFPIPWVDVEEESTLVPFETTTRTAAAASDLFVAECHDVTSKTEEYFQALIAPFPEHRKAHNPEIKERLLNDESAGIKLQNHLENMATRRTVILMGIFTKMGSEYAHNLDHSS